MIARRFTSAELGAVKHDLQELYAGLGTRPVLFISKGSLDPTALLALTALRAETRHRPVPLDRRFIEQSGDGSEQNDLLDLIGKHMGSQDLYDNSSNSRVDDYNFYGRSALLAQLETYIVSGRSVLLTGLRRVGKTLLLHRVAVESRWPAAVVDLQVSGERQLGVMCKSLLDGWTWSVEQKRRRYGWPELRLPEPVSFAEVHGEAAITALFIDRVETLLQALEAVPGQPGLVACLDEIGVTLRDPEEYVAIASLCKRLATHGRSQNRFATIVAGHNLHHITEQSLGSIQNPFFGFLSHITVGMLEDHEAAALIEGIGLLMDLKYDQSAVQLLVDQGGGHPLLTRNLCSRAWVRFNHERQRSAEQVEQVLQYTARQARYASGSSASDLLRPLLSRDEAGNDDSLSSLQRTLLQRLIAAPRPLSETELLSPDAPVEAQRAALARLEELGLAEVYEGGRWDVTIKLLRRSSSS